MLALLLLSCLVGGNGEAIYKGTPQTELWEGKKNVAQGSKDLKDRISKMRDVLARLKGAEQTLGDSIEEAEDAEHSHVELKADVGSAIRAFKDTVQDEALQREMKAEDEVEKTMTSLAQQDEKRPMQIRAWNKGGPYDVSDKSNIGVPLYNGVCPKSFGGCVEYASMMFHYHPDCLHTYQEDSFPILASLRCSVLPGCTGFSYGLNPKKTQMGTHLKDSSKVNKFSEEYEYLSDVGVVRYYNQDAPCPVPPKKEQGHVVENFVKHSAPRNLRANYVVYAKTTPTQYVKQSDLYNQRALTLGGTGCQSMLSHGGLFSGLQGVLASNSLSLASTSSGGTWMLALNTLKNGGHYGKKWKETWDSNTRRTESMGTRPVWNLMYHFYKESEQEEYTKAHARLAMSHMTANLNCGSQAANKSFDDCNAKPRSLEEVRDMVGTAHVCTRSPEVFKSFMSKYFSLVGATYSAGSYVDHEGDSTLSFKTGPTFKNMNNKGRLGYNLLGNLWAGIVKGWLFVPNGVDRPFPTEHIGWSNTGRWVNVQTHFTRTFAGALSGGDELKRKEKVEVATAAPVVPVHRYVAPVEMINGAAHGGRGIRAVEKTIVPLVALSSNVPVQSLLDLIWMVEGDMCTLDASQVQGTDTSDAAAAVGELALTPLLKDHKDMGHIWNALNLIDHDNTALTADLDGHNGNSEDGEFVDAEHFMESARTKSPLVMRVGYYLPDSGMNNKGYGGDSSTTDDSGLITAIKVLDDMHEDFRPKEVLTMLTTSDPWYLERYFHPTTSMWSTFMPMVEHAADKGVMCERSKNVQVQNPYHLFEASKAPIPGTTQLSMNNVSVIANNLHNVKGGFPVNLRIFSLERTDADNMFLSWLPGDYGSKLSAAGFPAYKADHGSVAPMFAVDFMKGWALYHSSALRGFLMTCSLINQGEVSHLEEAGETQTKVKHFGSRLLDVCSRKSSLNKIFHDNNVISSLVTMTRDDKNKFEGLRAHITDKMAGFKYWGLRQSYATWLAENSNADDVGDTQVDAEAAATAAEEKLAGLEANKLTKTLTTSLKAKGTRNLKAKANHQAKQQKQKKHHK